MRYFTIDDKDMNKMKIILIAALSLLCHTAVYASTHSYFCAGEGGQKVELVLNNGWWAGESIKFSDLRDDGHGPIYNYRGTPVSDGLLPDGQAYTYVSSMISFAGSLGLIVDQRLYDGEPEGTMAQTHRNSKRPWIIYHCQLVK